MSTQRTISAAPTIAALFALVIGILSLAACGAASRKEAVFSKSAAGAPMAAEMSVPAFDAPPAPEAARAAVAGDTAKPVAPLNAERKLVHRAGMTVQVADLAAGEASVRAVAAQAGGYIASASGDESGVALTLRVPQAAFEAALGSLPSLGRVLSRNVSAEDVTLRFYDLEGRLETKRLLADTFRGYLRGAKSIEDILAVETRLAELQDEIDSLGGQFAHLSDLIDFATIDVYLSLPGGAVPDGSPTLGDRLAKIFRDFGGFLSALAAGIVAFFVFGIPIALVAAAGFWLLFGKIGLLVRLFRAISRRKDGTASTP